MDLERYFDGRLKQANQDYVNFIDDVDFDDFDADNMLNAGGVITPQTSQAIVISVENTTTAAVSSVDIFGSYAVFSSYLVSGIDITSGVSGIAYRTILEQIKTCPIEVGSMYIYSTTAGQILETLKVVKTDINGNDASRLLTPLIAPNNYQTTATIINDSFTIDGGTKIRINSMLASATLKLYFFPSAKFNPAMQLVTGKTVRPYKRPTNLLQQDVVKLVR
ncbi:MAG: hypothetical protein ABIG64_09505 [Candidatus Omnitrophota bacterium]